MLEQLAARCSLLRLQCLEQTGRFFQAERFGALLRCDARALKRRGDVGGSMTGMTQIGGDCLAFLSEDLLQKLYKWCAFYSQVLPARMHGEAEDRRIHLGRRGEGARRQRE